MCQLAVRLLEGFTSQSLSFCAVDYRFAVECMVKYCGIILVPGLLLFLVFLGIWSTL